MALRVFDVPITVPRRDEYVANGAARQAGWAYLGRPVEWPLDIVACPDSDYQPLIRQQYGRYRLNLH